MFRRTILTVLCAPVLAALCSGCCLDRVYQCEDGCGYGLSGRFSEGEANAACSSCGDGSCQGGCDYTFSARVLRGITCGGGCGEVYWGEWISDPPDDCDTCDRDGNWIGKQCCNTGWLRRGLASLRGGRHGQFCGADCGHLHGHHCNKPGCGYGNQIDAESLWYDSDSSEVIETPGKIIEEIDPPQPTPAKQATSAKRTTRPYYVREGSGSRGR